MTTLKAVDVINSTLAPSSQISASLVSEKNISASITTGVVINQIEGGGTPSIATPGGATTQVQFNDDGTLGGAASVTYNKTTGALTGTLINAGTVTAVAVNGTTVNGNHTGDGSALTNITYTNVTGRPTLAPVATSGLYSDLTGKPVLGTAALVDSTVFATAAQGVKADTAIQSITSTDGSVAITTTGTARDLSVTYANQSRTLISVCRNNSGTPMTPGTVVYISTAQGSQPVISRAQANTEANSSKTFGIVQSTIADNGTGNVVVAGQLSGVNTLGLTTGASVWLSPSVLGGFTTTKPLAPDNSVFLGTVVYAHQNNGIIEVRVVNGYELEELHNVSLNGTTNGQVLTYESATSLWKAATPKSALSQFTNDADFITATNVTANFQAKDSDLTAIAALANSPGYVKKTSDGVYTLDNSTFLTAITSGQIITALGYTPYSAANPNAYVTAAATVARALVADSVLWTNVSGRPTALSQFSNDSGFITTTAANTAYQSKDADLTAISALSTTGYAKRTGTDTWALSTTVPWTDVSGKPTFATVATSGSYNDLSNKPTALSSFTNDSGFITTTAANTAYQSKDADLTTLAGLSDNGFVKRSGGQYVIDSTSVYLTDITSGQVTTALGYTPINPNQKGVANGVASLDSTGNVPLAQLPDSLENVVTVATYSQLPVTGVENKIYVVDDTNLIYRWDTNVYKSITTSVANTDAVPEGATNKYFTTARARSSINVSGSLTYDSVAGTVGYVAPTLATVATSGLYTDLIGEPTALSQFTNDSGFITTTAANTNYQSKDADLTAIAALAGTTGILKKTALNTWTLDTTAYLPTATAATTYQPLDLDLTSIAGLAGTTGLLRKTGANTFILDTTTYLTSALVDNVQPLDSDLTAISALPNSSGLLKKNSDGNYVLDTNVYLTNALLDSYQPLSDDLTAIDSLAGTSGYLKKTALNTWALDTVGFQAADADLTAIAALAGTTGILKKTALNTWTLDTTAYLPTATAATTYQPLDLDLTSIAGLAGTTGYLKKTAANTFVLDTATFQTADSDLTAIAALPNSAGLVKKTSDGVYSLDTSTYLTTATAATTYQPLDLDLTSIAGLAGTSGILKKTAANTFVLDTSTYQVVDADLTAIAGLAGTTGYLKKTGAGAYTLDTASYQPLDADLTAIGALAGTTGILKKTALNTWVLDTATYLTSITRVDEATELANGSAFGGLLGAGGGGAGRIEINTLAQAGSVDIDVAPITAAGGALTYTNVANFNATSIIPGVTDTISLGTDTKRWSAVYVKEIGTATVPSINLANGTVGGTGFYSNAAGDTITATVNGVAEVAMTGTNLYPVVTNTYSLGATANRWQSIIGGAGTAALPTIAVGSSLVTTGLYSEALGTLSFTNTGVKTGAIDSTGLTMVGKVEGARAKVGLGTTAIVGYALSGNGSTNTGLYSSTEGTINVSSLGNSVLSIDTSGNLTATAALIGTQVRTGRGTVSSVAHGMSGTGATGTGLFSATEGTINFASGGVEIGNITSAGNLTMNGIITAYSDSRLKEDLLPIISALDKVMTLQGYTYTKKSSGARETGLIAQDVKKVLPEAVLEDEYMSVAYGNMMGLIVEAIKELNTKIDKMEANK